MDKFIELFKTWVAEQTAIELDMSELEDEPGVFGVSTYDNDGDGEMFFIKFESV
jgi:hypothetical protein